MTDVSKYLSYVLRHKPEEAGLVPDRAGFVPVKDVLRAVTARFPELGFDRARLEDLVATNDKRRFELDFELGHGGGKIRATQGHTIDVDPTFGMDAARPPNWLYHGTSIDAVESIRSSGIYPRGRHAVHLSEDRDTAIAVGRRKGVPALLRIRAGWMCLRGHEFFLTSNGVWLVRYVHPQYILFPRTDAEREQWRGE